MKKQLIVFSVIAIAVVGAVIFFSSRSSSSERTSDIPVVAATIFPIADITEKIAGEQVAVDLILSPGASPHTFDPSPSTIRDLQGASVIFAVGYGLDDWAVDLAEATESDVVIVDDGIEIRETAGHHGHEEEEEHDAHHGHDEDEDGHDHEHGEEDPHYWLSLSNGAQIARTIEAHLSALYPEHEAVFEQNLANYLEKIDAAAEEAERMLAPLDNRNIVTFHDAWYYFAEDFGLTVAGTYEPTAAREPTPSYLAELTEGLEEAGTKTIYSEPQFGTANLEAFANDNGLTIRELDPIGGVSGRETYIDLILSNVRIVAQQASE